jgi:hypothetical protein
MKKFVFVIILFGALAAWHNVNAGIINQLDDLKISLNQLKNELTKKPSTGIIPIRKLTPLFESEILKNSKSFLKGIDNVNVYNALQKLITALKENNEQIEQLHNLINQFLLTIMDKNIRTYTMQDIEPILSLGRDILGDTTSSDALKKLKKVISKASVSDKSKIAQLLDNILAAYDAINKYLSHTPDVINDYLTLYKKDLDFADSEEPISKYFYNNITLPAKQQTTHWNDYIDYFRKQLGEAALG